MPNLLPVLLPWLAVLVLLALPSNRSARAWWIWAPLAGMAWLAAGAEAVFEAAENEEVGAVIQGLNSVAFGLAAVWLLGDSFGRRHRAAAVPLTALAFAAVGLLAFVVSPVFEEFWDLRRWVPALPIYLTFGIGAGPVYAGALHLDGWMSRRRFRGWLFALRLPIWLWFMWLAAGGLLAGIITFESGSSFEWVGFLMGTIIFALLSYGLILPFVILSFTCPFYKERLRTMLKLPASGVALPPAPPITPAEVSR